MRLLLDVMCGHLAGVCRMCGHDTVYALDRGVEADDRLLAMSRTESRTLVTRDVALAERADGEPGSILLSGTDGDGHLRSLRDAGVELTLDEQPSHCGRCNGPIEQVVTGTSDDGTGGDDRPPRPEYVPDGERPVWRCRDCDQHFWKGSHWADVRARLGGL